MKLKEVFGRAALLLTSAFALVFHAFAGIGYSDNPATGDTQGRYIWIFVAVMVVALIVVLILGLSSSKKKK